MMHVKYYPRWVYDADNRRAVVSDLHLSQSDAPFFFHKVDKLTTLAELDYLTVAGDILNDPAIDFQEVSQATRLADYCKEHSIQLELIRGNCDPSLTTAENYADNITVTNKLQSDDYTVVHGHEDIDTDTELVITGHLRPSMKVENRWKDVFIRVETPQKEIVIIPPFNKSIHPFNVRQIDSPTEFMPLFNSVSRIKQATPFLAYTFSQKIELQPLDWKK